MKVKNLHLFEYNCLSYFLIRAAFIGICLNNILIVAKQDSWISVILATILGFIPLFIYYRIFETKLNVRDFINEQCGKVIGNVINISICLFTFLFISIIFWNLINFISSQYLYKTPTLVISFTFAIALYYITTKNINVIGRIGVIILYMSFTLYILSGFGLSFQVDTSRVQPILEFGLISPLKGCFHFIAYNILPLFLLTIIPKGEITNTKNFIKNQIIFYILSILSLFIVSLFLLSIYGIEISQILQYPIFHVLKRISLIGFIERVESILSIQWIFDMFMFITIGLYFIKVNVQNLIKTKKTGLISFILVFILVILTNYLFKNNTFGIIFILKYMPPLIFFFYLIIPTVIYIIKKINRD